MSRITPFDMLVFWICILLLVMAQSLDHYSTIVGVRGGGIELNSVAGNGPDMVLRAYKLGMAQVFVIASLIFIHLIVFVFVAAFFTGARMIAGAKNLGEIQLQKTFREGERDYLTSLGLSEEILVRKIRELYASD